MKGSSVISSLGLLREVACLLDEGLIALDDAERVILATGRNLEPLGLRSADAGTPLPRSRTDYRVLRLLETARATGSAQSRDIRADDRDLVVRALPVQDNDVNIILLVRDETRIRHLERVRRDFISNVSHELRTPVTAVQLMAETLAAGALDDRDAAVDFVRRIALEATHMAQLLEELLELSTIESGLRPIASERVPLPALVATVDRLRPLAEAKELSLRVRVAPGTPDAVGDASRLGQVLRNLVHNAIKFTPAGGRIEVEAEAGDADTVVLRCRDSGVGIAPGDVERIFERFWKADNSRQRNGEGSGLGLAIVRHVVEAHGGSVSVDSEPRRGTTFTVILPAAR